MNKETDNDDKNNIEISAEGKKIITKKKDFLKQSSLDDLVEHSPERELMFKKRRKLFKIISILLVLIMLTVITIIVTPKVLLYRNDSIYRLEFNDSITDLGSKGIFVLLGLQIAQVVIMIIPSEPLDIISGVMFGPWIGLIICIGGNTLGILLVYGLIKIVGGDFVKSVIDLDKYKNKDYLNNPIRTEVFMAAILIFPGLPKDFLAFLMPFTKVKLHRFLIINIICRTPAIITSTYFGDSLLSGNKKLAITLMIIQGVISVLVIIFNKQISKISYRIGHKDAQR